MPLFVGGMLAILAFSLWYPPTPLNPSDIAIPASISSAGTSVFDIIANERAILTRLVDVRFEINQFQVYSKFEEEWAQNVGLSIEEASLHDETQSIRTMDKFMSDRSGLCGDMEEFLAVVDLSIGRLLLPKFPISGIDTNRGPLSLSQDGWDTLADQLISVSASLDGFADRMDALADSFQGLVNVAALENSIVSMQFQVITRQLRAHLGKAVPQLSAIKGRSVHLHGLCTHINRTLAHTRRTSQALKESSKALSHATVSPKRS
ncbi:hypothetical protein EIP91_004916 [Steccherinum ochraceum]|uniref:Uncharacterized protein n=1 Tax=Steccherinum ochraceum TaxID=92696 RepID=A0A4R0R7Z5_9APHY|nr:hypothetical protein EIP91_004916 [Steccherinum ochraceum]